MHGSQLALYAIAAAVTLAVSLPTILLLATAPTEDAPHWRCPVCHQRNTLHAEGCPRDPRSRELL